MYRNLNSIVNRIGSRDSFSGQAALTVLTNVAMAGTGMVTGLLSARLLGPAARGELAAIQSWVFFLGALATLGMSESLIYHIGRSPKESGRFLASTICMTGVAGCLWVLVSWLLLPYLLKAQAPGIVGAARYFAIFMIPLFATFPIYESLRALGAWRSWNLLRLLPNLGWLVCLAIAFGNPTLANPLALSRVYPFIFLIQLVPAILFASAKLNPPFAATGGACRTLLSYGLPTMFTVLPRTLNMRLDQLLMATLLEPSSLGLYVAAVAWGAAPAPVFTALGSVLFPRLSGTRDRQQQRRLVTQVLQFTVLVVVALTLLMLALTDAMIPLLFGVEFGSSTGVALVLVIAYGFSNVNTIVGSALYGLGSPGFVLLSESAGLAVTLTLLLLLIPRFGTVGAAVSTLCGYIGVCGLLGASLLRVSGRDGEPAIPAKG